MMQHLLRPHDEGVASNASKGPRAMTAKTMAGWQHDCKDPRGLDAMMKELAIADSGSTQTSGRRPVCMGKSGQMPGQRRRRDWKRIQR